MTRLLLSHYMPAAHGVHADFLAPWAARVMADCPSLEIDIACEGSELGLLENQFAQVSEGRVDIAHSPVALPRGRFPLTNLMNLPFLAADSGEASRRLWAAQAEFLAAEFAPLHLLALHADSGGVLHLRDAPLTGLADLAGKRIRTPAGAVAEAVAALGAEPVLLLPPAIGPAARAGEIDGAVMAWDVLAYTGTDTVFRHHHPEVFYVSPLYLVMNAASRARLGPEERAAIDRHSGADLAPRFGGYWQAWSQPGRALAEGPGHSITPLPGEVLEAFRTAAAEAVSHEGARLAADGLTAAPGVAAAFAGRAG
ncbi:C4-dicarboxylate ABC transporter [Oceanicella sp. SM1341]|uniref:C4-dicarboxylate ABC transporter n=1 Tax=Oceanicella sp. SM1341 TaxID=1548889 RepID=UPI000E532A30|nr:C4-dicarboxylate ABC transporter [Oceanicella sp. SM1341]